MPKSALINEEQALEALRLVKDEGLSIAKAATQLKIPNGSIVTYFRSIGFSAKAHKLKESRKKAHDLVGQTKGYVRIIKILNPEAAATKVKYDAECTYGGKGCRGRYVFNYETYSSALTKGRARTLSCGCYALEVAKKNAGSMHW